MLGDYSHETTKTTTSHFNFNAKDLEHGKKFQLFESYLSFVHGILAEHPMTKYMGCSFCYEAQWSVKLGEIPGDIDGVREHIE